MPRASRGFNPAFATAAQSAQAIREKKISASELLAFTYGRIDHHNQKINAIIWQCREKAVARARQVDEILAKGKTLGPLHGVPVTIKEAFAYQGSPNSWGLLSLKDGISPRSAIAVERLESAGAIVIGKTNVCVMLGDWQTYNPAYGTTNNPWDFTRTVGGSTGGGAAAVAAGLGCLTLGSDLSGSIRIPAHFCGVYGHKPTLELASTDGFQPGPWDGAPGFPMDLGVVGPLAREARDLALALRAIGGPNGQASKAWSWRMPPSHRKRLKDFRIGYVLDDAIAPVASNVGLLYENVVAELRRAGANMTCGWPEGIEPREQLETYLYLLFAFFSFDVSKEQLGKQRARLEQDPSDISAAAVVEPHGRWLRETRRRLGFRALWQKYFEKYDVFLLPAAFSTAFPHDHSEPLAHRVIGTPEGTRSYLNTPFWTCFATLAGLPATVAPIGRTDAGLPAGIQIVAPMWEDGTSIEFAWLLADAVGASSSPTSFENECAQSYGLWVSEAIELHPQSWHSRRPKG